MLLISISSITSSFTEEKKCTVEADQLEQETMLKEHLVKRRDLIKTQRRNPIFHKPQPLMKVESKFADSADSADFFDLALHQKGIIHF